MRKTHSHSAMKEKTFKDIPAGDILKVSSMNKVVVSGSIGDGVQIIHSGMGELYLQGPIGENVKCRFSGMGNVYFSFTPPDSIEINDTGMGQVIIPENKPYYSQHQTPIQHAIPYSQPNMDFQQQTYSRPNTKFQQLDYYQTYLPPTFPHTFQEPWSNQPIPYNYSQPTSSFSPLQHFYSYPQQSSYTPPEPTAPPVDYAQQYNQYPVSTDDQPATKSQTKKQSKGDINATDIFSKTFNINHENGLIIFNEENVITVYVGKAHSLSGNSFMIDNIEIQENDPRIRKKITNTNKGSIVVYETDGNTQITTTYQGKKASYRENTITIDGKLVSESDSRIELKCEVDRDKAVIKITKDSIMNIYTGATYSYQDDQLYIENIPAHKAHHIMTIENVNDSFLKVTIKDKPTFYIGQKASYIKNKLFIDDIEVTKEDDRMVSFEDMFASNKKQMDDNDLKKSTSVLNSLSDISPLALKKTAVAFKSTHAAMQSVLSQKKTDTTTDEHKVKSLRTYVATFDGKPSNQDVLKSFNLSDKEFKEEFEELIDIVTLDIPNIPVLLDGKVYDYNTLMQILSNEDVTKRIDPISKLAFTEADIQKGTRINNQIQKVFDKLEKQSQTTQKERVLNPGLDVIETMISSMRIK